MTRRSSLDGDLSVMGAKDNKLGLEASGMKILHTADWQIGTQFGQFTAEEAAHLAEARLETVRSIATIATQRGVDAVLVAGDVFDQQTVSETTIRKLFAAVSGYEGPWYLLPGNHDAALAESVWTRAQRLRCVPENVHLLLKPGVILLDEQKCALLCAPLTQRNTYEDTTAFFDEVKTPDGYLRVGLAHGSVTGILQEDVDSTNPIAQTRAQTAGLDYLALGDWHGEYRVNERICYSGTHEQDRFRSNQPGYVLEVDLHAPGVEPNVQRRRVSKFQWHHLRPAIEVPTDVSELRTTLSEFGEKDVLRIDITGTLALADAEALNVLIEETRARVRALRSSTTGIKVLPTEEDLSALGARSGYLAKVVERLRTLQGDEAQAAVASEALLMLARIQRDTGAA